MDDLRDTVKVLQALIKEIQNEGGAKDIHKSKMKGIHSKQIKFDSRQSENCRKEPKKKITCDMCKQIFGRNCDLEKHIKTKHENHEKFECDQCNQKFVTSWRLMMHTKGHTLSSQRNCHYFNNGKLCPFEDLGCKFSHTLSMMCKFDKKCSKNLCAYQHSRVMDKDNDLNDEEYNEHEVGHSIGETETSGSFGTSTSTGSFITSTPKKLKLQCENCQDKTQCDGCFVDQWIRNRHAEEKQEC